MAVLVVYTHYLFMCIFSQHYGEYSECGIIRCCMVWKIREDDTMSNHEA